MPSSAAPRGGPRSSPCSSSGWDHNRRGHGRRRVHLNGNPAVTLDGDRATSVVIWSYITHDDDGFPLLLQLGHYYDDLVREDGAWRFQRRRITRDLGFSPARCPRTRPTRGDRMSGDATIEAELAELRGRLARLEDIQAIWRLFMEYRRHLDRRDFAAYAQLFAEDGEWLGNLGHARGPAEIEQLLIRTLERHADESVAHLHLIDNAVIDVDGDRATSESTWVYITQGLLGQSRALADRPLPGRPCAYRGRLEVPAPRGLPRLSVFRARPVGMTAGERTASSAPPDLAVLEAVVSRLIPSDENGPGAAEAQVARYITRALDGDYRHHRRAYEEGLEAIDGHARSSFRCSFVSLAPSTRMPSSRT